jgi:signal transduction histidine kinase
LEERLAERERIARDLHDTLLQGFVSAYMQLDVANDRLPPDSPAKPLVQRVLDLMRQVSEEGRHAIRRLHSPGSGGNDLDQVLSRVQEELPAQSPVDFRVIVEGKHRELHPVVREEACRIAREAIINAFRHANATSIEVEIEYGLRRLGITVRDNGCGVDSKVRSRRTLGPFEYAGASGEDRRQAGRFEPSRRWNGSATVRTGQGSVRIPNVQALREMAVPLVWRQA